MATQIIMIQHMFLVLIYLREIFATQHTHFNIHREPFMDTRRLYQHL